MIESIQKLLWQRVATLLQLTFDEIRSNKLAVLLYFAFCFLVGLSEKLSISWMREDVSWSLSTTTGIASFVLFALACVVLLGSLYAWARPSHLKTFLKQLLIFAALFIFVYIVGTSLSTAQFFLSTHAPFEVPLLPMMLFTIVSGGLLLAYRITALGRLVVSEKFSLGVSWQAFIFVFFALVLTSRLSNAIFGYSFERITMNIPQIFLYIVLSGIIATAIFAIAVAICRKYHVSDKSPECVHEASGQASLAEIDKESAKSTTIAVVAIGVALVSLLIFIPVNRSIVDSLFDEHFDSLDTFFSEQYFPELFPESIPIVENDPEALELIIGKYYEVSSHPC